MKMISWVSLGCSLVILTFSACGPNEATATTETIETETNTETPTMELSNKEKAIALIESLETGDMEPVSYINPEKYIQHNLAVADGLEGFGAVMANQPAGGFKAKVVRAFEDGDFVVLHTEYDFFGPKAGFDIFRFENGLIVEHWDNLAEITPPNPSGRTQLDGATQITDLDQTEANKALARGFVTDVLMNGEGERTTDYISTETYLQHNSAVADGLDGLGAALQYFADNNLVMEYDELHYVIGEGNFVLTASEGKFGAGDQVAFYDLFRIEDGKIVEHWDIIQEIPAESEWANTNGKF
ncbi:MAG: nuclear transport factor 2 family protein [Bacteroidota bacterium]